MMILYHIRTGILGMIGKDKDKNGVQPPSIELVGANATVY